MGKYYESIFRPAFFRCDSERAHAPLRAAPDAETVDTTGLTADEAAERLLKRVLERARP